MKFRIILFLSLIIVLVQCKNDFEVNDDWKDITVVYGLLNSADSIQYVRVTKAFLGDADAYIMAQQSDSLYYKNVDIVLEEWLNSVRTDTFIMVKDSVIPRDSGIFAYNKNIVYKTAHPLDPNAKYKLVIHENNKEITSETSLIKDFYVPTLPPMISLYGDQNGLLVEWTTPPNARIFEVTLKFRYYEITATDTTKDSIEISLPRQISSSIDGGENMSTLLLGSQFLSSVGAKIKQKPEVIKRVVAKYCFGFSFMVGTDDLYTYMQVNAPATGIVTERPAYTNVNNGIGIFTSRLFKQIPYNRMPSQQTVDALTLNSVTSGLKFLKYSETTPLWTGTGFNFP